MLVAKREPFELGAQGRPVPPAQHAPVSSRFTRTLHFLQMLGALVAVPAGLGSAYTMYKTTYSAEATCQSLRANIVAMLDRNVDAGVRRALVRRDVAAFEQSCSAADPDATAAFKTLLARDQAPPALAAPVAAPSPQPQAAMRKLETAPASKAEAAPVKAESLPAAKPKAPPARTAAAPESADPETPMSDAAWLAAVRSALANHRKHAVPPQAAPNSLGAPQSVGGMPPPQALPAPPAAPTLPPPASVARPAPPVGPDRPVPPGAIPEAAPPGSTKRPSRMGELMSEIPFFGKTLADHLSR